MNWYTTFAFKFPTTDPLCRNQLIEQKTIIYLFNITNAKDGAPLGRIEKGVNCSVSGCGNSAIRSISADKAKAAGLNVGSAEKRAYLCKIHYKEFKKKTKKDKTLDKWRYNP